MLKNNFLQKGFKNKYIKLLFLNIMTANAGRIPKQYVHNTGKWKLAKKKKSVLSKKI